MKKLLARDYFIDKLALASELRSKHYTGQRNRYLDVGRQSEFIVF